MKRQVFLGNPSEAYAALGLSAKADVSTQKIAILSTSEQRTVPATWDEIISTARKESLQPDSRFAQFGDKDAAFWNSLKSLEYKTQKPLFQSSGNSLETFSRRLDEIKLGDGKLFTARTVIDDELGANEWFKGDGKVTYPDIEVRSPLTGKVTGTKPGPASAREVAYGDKQIALLKPDANGKYPEIAFVDMLEAKGGVKPFTEPQARAVTSTPTIPDVPNTWRAETRYGAAAGGVTSGAITSFRAYDDLRAGRITREQAAMEIGKQTAFGTVVGGGSAVLENYATRGVSYFAGGTARTALGQLARQTSGAGVAGAAINTGFALYDNHAKYRSGEISGARYAGNVTAETIIGGAAGAGGAAAGAYIGGVLGTAIPIPVVGTLLGVAVGAGVGMGIDYTLRATGADKAIANAATATIEAGQRLAGDAKQLGANAVNQLQAAGTQAVTNIRATGTRAVNQGRAVINQGRTAVNTAVATTRQAVRTQINAAREFGNRVSTGARAYANAKLTQARQTFSHGTRAVTQAYTQAKQQVAQTVNRTVEQAQQTYQQASNYVSNTVNQAQQRASNFVNNATSSLRSAFGW